VQGNLWPACRRARRWTSSPGVCPKPSRQTQTKGSATPPNERQRRRFLDYPHDRDGGRGICKLTPGRTINEGTTDDAPPAISLIPTIGDFLTLTIGLGATGGPTETHHHGQRRLPVSRSCYLDNTPGQPHTAPTTVESDVGRSSNGRRQQAATCSVTVHKNVAAVRIVCRRRVTWGPEWPCLVFGGDNSTDPGVNDSIGPRTGEKPTANGSGVQAALKLNTSRRNVSGCTPPTLTSDPELPCTVGTITDGTTATSTIFVGRPRGVHVAGAAATVGRSREAPSDRTRRQRLCYPAHWRGCSLGAQGPTTKARPRTDPPRERATRWEPEGRNEKMIGPGQGGRTPTKGTAIPHKGKGATASIVRWTDDSGTSRRRRAPILC